MAEYTNDQRLLLAALRDPDDRARMGDQFRVQNGDGTYQQARVQAGLSLGQAARLLGIERPRLGDLEWGRESLPDDLRARMLTTYDVDAMTGPEPAANAWRALALRTIVLLGAAIAECVRWRSDVAVLIPFVQMLFRDLDRMTAERDALRAQLATEREACAVVCEGQRKARARGESGRDRLLKNIGATDCAKAIRARGGAS